jgi:phosphoglycerate dehydrogenase-like enzyme
MPRIAVLDDYQSVAAQFSDWSQVPDADVTEFHEHLGDEDAVAAALHDFEVVIAMRERTAFRRSLLERLPNLRLLVTTGRRNKSIDVEAAQERGIVVSGTGILPNGTAELTWGLILAVARNIPREDASVRAGGWQTSVGTDLSGARLGVLGLGNQGVQVARIGLAFEMDVVAWSENLTDERAAEVGVTRVDREELFSTADVLTIHTLLSKRTRGLVGPDDLGRMKPTAILINTSRGPIVRQDALLDALTTGRIAGAGLDVFDEEPLPADHPLRSAPRTVLTPHLGYVTRNTYEVFYREAVEDVAAWLAGNPLRVINP